MRVFVAVEVPEEIRRQIFDLQRSISSKEARVRWVAKKNIHLTLVFLGELSEKKVEEVKEVLKNIKHKKFKIYVDEIGFFPNKSNPNVVWVGLEPEKEILELQNKVDGELLSYSMGKDQKFKAHVTIGRINEIKDKTKFFEKLNVKIKGEFVVEEFILFSSTLTKDGPKYRILEKYSL
ncbi:MAG: RNA 2',3'-cyclic phosphodiesterase [Candidatus Nanoarchaeia archaeon]|nr:RNA 2',3'-cyclic phosphodiesterase [Candidatus Nanoarchaeia archaeon]